MTRRCGFVALLGAPNAGKSRLTNALVGQKISIVTHKVQTTRTRIRAILTEGESQIVLVDTPGIFQPRKRLERAMVAAAWRAVEESDLRVLVFDSQRREVDPATALILEGLRNRGLKAVLALNKVDLIRRERLLELAARFQAEGLFEEIFMVSAETGDGVEDLRAHLAAAMPEGPWHFPEDEVSDLPERMLAAEVTREKLFLQLHQELPYALAVETVEWTDFDNGDARIEQIVTVQRDSQRMIVLGKGGQTVKTVREAAQAELEAMLERRVHLFLTVKVDRDWAEKRAHYNLWDLPFE